MFSYVIYLPSKQADECLARPQRCAGAHTLLCPETGLCHVWLVAHDFFIFVGVISYQRKRNADQ